MTGLTALWLPILLSAVLVFVASSVIHMASPWHKSDYPKLPNEDTVMTALRPLGIPPGDYFIPRPSSREDMRSPEFAQKVKAGPVMVFTVMPSGGISTALRLPSRRTPPACQATYPSAEAIFMHASASLAST